MTLSTDRRTFLKGGMAGVAALGLGVLGGCGDESLPVADGARPDATGDLLPPGRDGSDGGIAGELGLPDGPVGDMGPGEQPIPDTGPAAKRPDTTVRQRHLGVLSHAKQSTSQKKLWGVTQLGAGETHQRLDWLKVDVTAGPSGGAPASLLYLSHLTDTHIVDEESPARSVSADGVASPAWRAQEAHASQVLDAMVRKINKFHAFRPMDLVLVTGDTVDNNQKNEFSWFLKILEGGQVQPNSGSLEDPTAGQANDPHDAFTAAGLGTIPWFVCHGNHDGLIQGNFPMDAWLKLDYSVIVGDPTRGKVTAIDLGRVNPPTCNAIPSDESALPPRCIPTSPGKLGTGTLPSDQDRAHLKIQDWLSMLHKASGLPVGHGLTSSQVSGGVGDFTVDPVPGLPLRLVVLDTCAKGLATGEYGADRISSFLKPALQKAVTDQVLVIVASHHPSDGIPLTGSLLRQALGACENVILHLCGHKHRHAVQARIGSTPLLGYWEVETCSLIDFPQQGRLVELVDNRDGTAELWMTLFDFDTDHQPGGPMAAASRFLSLYEIHCGDEGGSGEGKAGDRNVILPVALPQAVRTKLALLPGKPIESKLFS